MHIIGLSLLLIMMRMCADYAKAWLVGVKKA